MDTENKSPPPKINDYIYLPASNCIRYRYNVNTRMFESQKMANFNLDVYTSYAWEPMTNPDENLLCALEDKFRAGIKPLSGTGAKSEVLIPCVPPKVSEPLLLTKLVACPVCIAGKDIADICKRCSGTGTITTITHRINQEEFNQVYQHIVNLFNKA